jgi:hypothetical protein
MNTIDITLIILLALGWLGSLIYAYAAGLYCGYEDGREARDSREISDLLEEENGK